jgi:endonuclease/exonuclease/phosphatase (EEP) superfamily protein YafD
VRTLTVVTLLLTIGCARMPFTAEPPARILVLNLHGGKDAAGQSNVDAVALLIKKAGADLVLLQDVDSAALQALGSKLNYAAAAGGGVAALARGYIGFHTTVPLTPAPRAALAVLASIRTGPYAAINAQINPAEGRVSDDDLARVLDAINSQKSAGTPLVVGGDFNATPDHPGIARLNAVGLRDAWTECGSGDGFTYPSNAPAKRIDYLFLNGDVHCSAAVVMETQVSDHRPLLVTLK